jgi:hypothetical protein
MTTAVRYGKTYGEVVVVVVELAPVLSPGTVVVCCCTLPFCHVVVVCCGAAFCSEAAGAGTTVVIVVSFVWWPPHPIRNRADNPAVAIAREIFLVFINLFLTLTDSFPFGRLRASAHRYARRHALLVFSQGVESAR